MGSAVAPWIFTLMRPFFAFLVLAVLGPAALAFYMDHRVSLDDAALTEEFESTIAGVELDDLDHRLFFTEDRVFAAEADQRDIMAAIARMEASTSPCGGRAP